MSPIGASVSRGISCSIGTGFFCSSSGSAGSGEGSGGPLGVGRGNFVACPVVSGPSGGFLVFFKGSRRNQEGIWLSSKPSLISLG